jgi:hypothetical protein
MNIIPSKTSAIALPADDDPYAEIAMEGGGQFGKILKYVKGGWSHGDNPIPLGTEFLALMPDCMRGDVRFENGLPVEHRIGLIRNRATFARRADLGFTDQSLWENDKKGTPVDPWSPQTFLPLQELQTGELYCYIFRSQGGKQTFRDLCRAYSPYRAGRKLPVISLQTDRYDHADYSWIDIPILKVVRWEEAGDDTTLVPDSGDGGGGIVGEVGGGSDSSFANSKAINEKIKAATKAAFEDMNDDIPF